MKDLLRGVCIGVMIAIVFFTVVIAFAQDKGTRPPFTVITALNKKSFTIGEVIQYKVVISAGKDIDVELVELNKGFEKNGFEFMDTVITSKGFLGKKEVIGKYFLKSYSTGTMALPEIVVQYKGKNHKDWNKYTLAKETIEVKSLLSKSPQEAVLRDIKPPLRASRSIFLIVFVVCVIVAVAIFLYRKYFLAGQKDGAKVKIKSAHEIAYEQLEALQKKELIRQGKLKEYFSEISDILRRYLEHRFDFRAPEMTTEEFLVNARESLQVIKTHKDSLRGFLVSCDLVKFAKYSPEEAEISSVYMSAKKFIDETKEEVIVDSA